MPEKLVRDKIPEIARREGVDVEERRAEPGERLGLLLSKLEEEVAELKRNPCLEELADVYEVLRWIAWELGYTLGEVVLAADRKRRERGGFYEGIVARFK